MKKKKKTALFLTVVPLVIILALLGWFLTNIFEGERPQITIQPLPDFLSGGREFTLDISDMKRGLKILRVSVAQGSRKTIILEKNFSFTGLLNRKGIHRFNAPFFIDPSKLGLAQGRVDLVVRVWDYSRRRGGDGNLALVEHKMIVDTIPPSIRAISRMHYVNLGGTGMVVYQASSDSTDSGLFVNDLFFPGFPADEISKKGFHVCYFAIPYNTMPLAEIYLWAKDKAGNSSKTNFYCRIRRKHFRTAKIKITDGFLRSILPYFSFYPLDKKASEIEQFLHINRELRQKNAQTFYDLRKKTSPEKLWEGTWLRLKNAAKMAGFGDHRSYFYKGKKIDEQTHMGVDLASLANSEVQSANHGRVIYAGRLGIYGLTVVLDHGQGLASSYSHLSTISVKMDEEIVKGQVIGITGQTGLAGGDHLHFGVMVNGVCVNPIEWWDPHWIQDNITAKLELVRNPG